MTDKLIILYKSSLVFVENVAQVMVLWVLTLRKIQEKSFEKLQHLSKEADMNG
jgi:hypothetical protein